MYIMKLKKVYLDFSYLLLQLNMSKFVAGDGFDLIVLLSCV